LNTESEAVESSRSPQNVESSPVDRARQLAEYSQAIPPGGSGEEMRFAWDAYLAAGGRELTPWRAFQAGLAAQVSWLEHPTP
jgi:hypothetical protein